MDDREKVKIVSAFQSLLTDREGFIAETRWRGREWAKLIFALYYRIRVSDDTGRMVAQRLVLARGRRVALSDKQVARLAVLDKELDEWDAKCGGTVSSSSQTTPSEWA